MPSDNQTQDTNTQLPGYSCKERIEFAEGWLKNFMKVLDETVDGQTRCQIKEANGSACAERVEKLGIIMDNYFHPFSHRGENNMHFFL